MFESFVHILIRSVCCVYVPYDIISKIMRMALQHHCAVYVCAIIVFQITRGLFEERIVFYALSPNPYTVGELCRKIRRRVTTLFIMKSRQ